MRKLDTTDSVEELRFTPKDILLKRDIDFINKIKLVKYNSIKLIKILKKTIKNGIIFMLITL